ncbi:MAG: hypothetical protein U0Z17_10500 [Bacteroidales bacterium]
MICHLTYKEKLASDKNLKYLFDLISKYEMSGKKHAEAERQRVENQQADDL